MKTNYYRLTDGNFNTVATYIGTKSNANAYFKRFLLKCPGLELVYPFNVLVFKSFIDMADCKNSISMTSLF